MRPLRLNLAGFTAYPSPTEVDFQGLDLFAITGPTGAGKSSLLDAMAYALYGRAPRLGDQRQLRLLISQGHSRLRVSLEFWAGGRRYRVSRSTAAEGAGKGQVQLERWNGAAWETLADRAGDVEEGVRRIVGLDYGAFTRAVLLPQGRFQGFLLGGRQEQDAVLEDLLELERYRDVMRRAGARAALHGDRAAAARRRLEGELAGATPERERELRRRLLSIRHQIACCQAIMSAAEGLLPHLRGVAQARSELAQAEAAAQRLQEGAAAARREADGAAAALAELEEALGEVRAEGERLGYSAREHSLARAALERGQELVGLEEQERERAREERQARQEAAAWGKERLRLERERERALEACRQAEERERAAQERATGMERALAAAEEAGRALAGAQRRLNELRGRCRQQEERRERARKQAQAAREALARAQDELQEARRQADELRDRHAAHLLRARLRPGAPCPVCGSPAPHVLPGAEALPDLSRAEERLRRLEAMARQLERAAAAAEAEARAAAGELERIGKEMEEAEREAREQASRVMELAGGKGRSLEQAVGELKKRAQAARAEAGAAAESAAQARQAYEAAVGQLEEARRAEAQAAARAEALAQERLRLRERMEELRRQVGERPDLPALEEALQEMERRLARHEELVAEERRLLAEVERARSVLDQASRQADRAEGQLKQAAGRAQVLREELDRLLPAVLEGLRRQGWEDEAAMLARGEDPSPAVAGRLEQAREQLAEAERERGRIEEQLARLQQDMEAAREARRQMEEDERRARTAQRLAELLRSDRLQAFLRQEALSTLAAGGSRWLEMLSRGRYRLTADEQGFAVIDHWNGAQPRPAGTLSGGETFLASLALALAMAETLTAFSEGAGRALESIFIDEGFSALDDESLDLAAAALEELAAGERMVGIVTHLPALAYRLPARLKVAREGAQARVEREV